MQHLLAGDASAPRPESLSYLQSSSGGIQPVSKVASSALVGARPLVKRTVTLAGLFYLLGMAPGLPSVSGSPAAADQPATTPATASSMDVIATAISTALANPNVQVKVLQQNIETLDDVTGAAPHKYIAVLSGRVSAQDHAIVKPVVNQFVDKGIIGGWVDGLIDLASDDKAVAQTQAMARPETFIWQLTFSSNKVTPTLPTTTPSSDSGGASGASASATGTATGDAHSGNGATGSDSGGGGASGAGSDAQTGGQAAPSDNNQSVAKSRVDSIVAALNATYGSGSAPAVAQRISGDTILLRGSHKIVMDMRRDLTALDEVWPQVQMDMWTVQVSGSPNQVSRNMRDIHQHLTAARDAMAWAKGFLFQLAEATWFLDAGVDHMFSSDAGVPTHLGGPMPTSPLAPGQQGLLAQIGFDEHNARPLSLTEAFIFLALQQELKDSKALDIDKIKNSNLPQSDKDKQIKDIKDDPANYSRKQRILHLQQAVVNKIQRGELDGIINPIYLKHGNKEPQHLPFWRLVDAYDDGDRVADRNGIQYFANALLAVKNNPYDSTAVAQLPVKAAAADRLLKAAMDAFTEDMQEMFLDPILDDVEQKSTRSSHSGVALTGRVRMVVTSRIESQLAPSLNMYVDTTRPRPLNVADVTGALGASGLAGTLTRLSNPQVLLFNTLLSQPEPELTKVAPGIAINVRPTVLPDGGSARLQMDFRFGVETSILSQEQGRNGLWKSVPADAIESHHATTDATISAFDLFDISSFAIETSHPRSRYLPVIGQIPILGELLKMPASNKTVHQESLVVINTAILPRAFGLARFYGN